MYKSIYTYKSIVRLVSCRYKACEVSWYSLLVCLLPVVQEEEGGGQEEHATEHDDKGAQHEGIAQAEELPQDGRGIALLEAVRDLDTHTHTYIR